MKKKNLKTNSMFFYAAVKRTVKSFSGTVLVLLCLTVAPAFVFAQQKAVTGRVTNESGVGVEASVIIKGTPNGTKTDADGNYTIQVAAGAKLVISAVEYVAQEFTVAKANVINAVLVRVDKALNEVVVIGYGTQRKKDVTGAVVSIKGDVVREIASPNIAQALQGRIAGVDIARNGTTPGAGGQIRIRGNRGLNTGNDPFIVVDGIPYPGSINDLTPWQRAARSCDSSSH